MINPAHLIQRADVIAHTPAATLTETLQRLALAARMRARACQLSGQWIRHRHFMRLAAKLAFVLEKRELVNE